jgi:hypothetical protein
MTQQEGEARCGDQVRASLSVLLRAQPAAALLHLLTEEPSGRRRNHRSRDDVWLHKPYIFCAVARD